MNIDRMIFRFAGSVIVLSVALAHFHSPWWLLLTLFVGVNLFQSSFTGFCPVAIILRMFGVAPGCAFPSDKHTAAKVES